MFKSKKFIYLMSLLTLFLTDGCKQEAPAVSLGNYLVKDHLTTDHDSIEIKELMDTLLENTKWSGKMQLNHIYNPEKINVYIIDGSDSYVREQDRITQIISNCAYMGSNVICLDDAYLRSFLLAHHVAELPRSIDTASDQLCFLYWVIGHELGHLVCGHLHGHFDARSLDHFVNSSSIDNKEELQADSFFVKAIQSHDSRRIAEETLMMGILNAEIRQKIGNVEIYGVGIFYDYTNEHIVTYAKQPTHPEYVIRLSRMLELSTKMSGEEGLYNLVGGFIKQLKAVK